MINRSFEQAKKSAKQKIKNVEARNGEYDTYSKEDLIRQIYQLKENMQDMLQENTELVRLVAHQQKVIDEMKNKEQ